MSNFPLHEELNSDPNPDKDPKKVDPTNRVLSINVTCNPAEYDLIKSLAEKDSRKMPEFLREVGLKYDAQDTAEVRFKILCAVIEQTYAKGVEILKYIKK